MSGEKPIERKVYEAIQVGGTIIGLAVTMFFGRNLKNIYRDSIWDEGFEDGVDWARTSWINAQAKKNQE